MNILRRGVLGHILKPDFELGRLKHQPGIHTHIGIETSKHSMPAPSLEDAGQITSRSFAGLSRMRSFRETSNGN